MGTPEIELGGAGPEGVIRACPLARDAPRQHEKMTKKISHFWGMARFFLSKRGQRVDRRKFQRAWYLRRRFKVKVKVTVKHSNYPLWPQRLAKKR